MSDPDRQPPATPSGLPWPAALLVIAAAVGAILVGATSGFGLVFAIPYGAVGALLAIRRPRTSMGWILLAMGWLHALAAATIDATPAQFATGPSLPLVVAAVASASAGTATFIGYALIAMVFPSGRLPGGRWGRVARSALAVDVVLTFIGTLTPQISVGLSDNSSALVPNPISVAPDLPIWNSGIVSALFLVQVVIFVASALSLFVRLRRSDGIERQQLRWITVAVILVVGAVLTGLVLSALIPGAADSGLVWIPAIIAFPTVPIAVGVAVLRYRLYDIDTIVNRAIVYGLLTAILAGASAAAISLFERVFEGVVGPGSDASIILTTLLVVTAFNPVKNRLQQLVDRRFKEVRDPVADLAAFEAEIRGGIARPDRQRVLRRLVEVSMNALASTGATLVVHGPASEAWTTAAGKPIVGDPFVVTAAARGAEAQLTLAGVAAPRAVDSLQSALVTALEETAST